MSCDSCKGNIDIKNKCEKCGLLWHLKCSKISHIFPVSCVNICKKHFLHCSYCNLYSSELELGQDLGHIITCLPCNNKITKMIITLKLLTRSYDIDFPNDILLIIFNNMFIC